MPALHSDPLLPSRRKPGCTFWSVATVALSFATAGVIARALLEPSPASVRGLVQTCWIVLYVEATMLVPMTLASGRVFGRDALLRRLGLAAAAVAFGACAAAGSAGYGAGLAVFVYGRVARLAEERPHLADTAAGWRWMLAFTTGRWFVQWMAFLAAMLVSNLAMDLLRLLPPESRGILRLATKPGTGLVDVVAPLMSGCLYYALTGLNELFRLPCLFPSLQRGERP